MIDWNVDPQIFSLGFLKPRYYGVSWALAFWLSYVVLTSIFRKEGRPQKDLDSLAMYIIIGTLLGARFGHVLFYEPEIIASNPLEFFAVWQGGLASHGGALGIITGLWLFHRKNRRYTMLWLLDRLAIVAALSGALIRIGNLFNSEILGSETTLPWGVWFQRVDPLPVYRHPAQMYEALVCMALYGLMRLLYARGMAMKHPGRMIGTFLILLFTSRFFIEFIKLRQVDFETTLPIDMGQILSLPFIALGVWLLARSSKPLQAA